MTSPPKNGALLPDRPALAIQSVLFRNSANSIFKSIQSIGRSTDVAINCGSIASVELIYGDCGDAPIFSADVLNEFASNTALM